MAYSSRIPYRALYVFCIALAALLGDAERAFAAVPEAGKVATYTSSLSRFMARDEPIALRNTSSEYVLFVPIPARWQPQRARLHLEFTNSIALLPQRSQLLVSVNRRLVAQLPLKSTSPDGVVDITLPVDALTAGYNQLKFEVAQHYTEDCEDPTAPELWTRIDTLASRLELEVAPKSGDLRLSQLADLFDRRSWGDFPLSIVAPPGTPPEQLLRWGGLAAQAAALRLDYVPLALDYLTAENATATAPGRRLPGLAQAALRGRDAVLVGTRDALAPYLGAATAQQIRGSFLGLFPLDEDPQHFVLVVSGTNAEEVDRAATALLFLNFPYADAATMHIAALSPPELAQYAAPGAVHPGARYRFADLGYDTATLQGYKQSNLSRAALTLWLPPDLYTREDANVVLALHMVYGAGLREDSVLNVMLNDRFENVIPLNDKDGAMFRDYRVHIPLRSFRPGYNTLSFEPRMTSLVSDHCKLGQSENMLLTLFEDSTLQLPAAAHYVALPDLALFARSGFPYTRSPDGAELTVQVTGDEPATIAAAWTLLARLAQVQGLPLYRATWRTDAPAAAADVLLIGPRGRLDAEMLRAAPLGLTPEVAAPLQTRVDVDRAETTWWQRLWGADDGVLLRPAMAQVQQSGGLGRYTALAQFASPYHADRTVTLLTAADVATLAAGTRALVQPAVWNNMDGAVTVWREDGSDLQTREAETQYHSGEVGVGTRMQYYFSNYPLYGGAIIVLLLVAVALLTWLLLRQFRRRRHPHVTGSV